MRNFTSEIKLLQQELIETRRDLHRHPELAFEEIRTAKIVAHTLNELGLEVQTNVGQTGVVAILEGVEDGPLVLVRCDMDALPISEETGAEYSSTFVQKMHACGHDGHTAIGMSVAKVLSQYKNSLKGRVKFVFQPAEETGMGALAMIDDGVLTAPKPDVFLGLHLWNEIAHGEIVVVPGPIMGGCDNFTVTIQGRGGHAALPDRTHDPIITMVQTISSLQTITSRNVAPLETAVISVTQIKAGDTFNVIPDRVQFFGTIRTFDLITRELVLARFNSIIEQTAALMNCTATVEIDQKTPPVINDGVVTKRLYEGFQQILPELTYRQNFRTMASEDVAYFLEQVPGTFLMIGSANHERGLDYPHHHPKFNFDEKALVTGASVLATAISEYVLPDDH